MVEPKKKEWQMRNFMPPILPSASSPTGHVRACLFLVSSSQIWTHQHTNFPSQLPFVGFENQRR